MTMTAPRVLLDEDFGHGLVVGERWQYVAGPDFCADDGTVTTTSDGISVAPPTRHPETGEPMFTKEISGSPGHLKWMVASTDSFPATDGPLRVQFRVRVQGFGMSRQPYGPDVLVDADDMRLGSATLNVLDFSTGMIFDFWVSSSTIVPFYERMRPPHVPFAYEAFCSVAPAVPRRPGDVHDVAIVLDSSADSVHWEVDGAVVATVRGLGPSSPDWTTVLHHGGQPERVVPAQVQVGMGLLTLLDASAPGGSSGLVDLGTHYEHPTAFAAEGPVLFGQGVELEVHALRVERG